MTSRPGRPGRPVLISAHKGGAERARPATYEAYQDSVTTGADYVEFDIRRTRDRELVVFHDALDGLSYAELCAVAGYRVPLVADVMRLLPGRAAGHLDLKETGYEEDVVALALDLLGPGNFVVTTLQEASVAVIKRAFPQVKAALSLGRNLQGVPPARWPAVRAGELLPLARVRACGADWVAVNYKLARLGVTRTCLRAGVGVMIWTVDSGRLIDEIVAAGRIDVLVTNRPRHAVARRAALAGVRRPG